MWTHCTMFFLSTETASATQWDLWGALLCSVQTGEPASKNENVKLREKLRFVTCLRGGKRGGLGGCLGGSGLRFTLALWLFSGSVFAIWGGGGGSGAVIGFEWARGRGETGGGKLVKEDSSGRSLPRVPCCQGPQMKWEDGRVSSCQPEEWIERASLKTEEMKNIRIWIIEACFCYWFKKTLILIKIKVIFTTYLNCVYFS